MQNVSNISASKPGTGSVAPLPHITVHAFAETQQGLALFQQVAMDRLMSRTNMQIFQGGIPAAVQAYSQAMTPELLVVESTKPRDGLFADLAALAQVCLPHTRVVVIGHQNDIFLYRELLAEGVSDYLAMPLEPARLIASFSAIFQAKGSQSLGSIVAFIGARGGVGSSTVAHNVAWFMANEFEKNTVVADLDLAFGTAALDFDINPSQTIVEALAADKRIDSVFVDRLLARCAERLMLLASPARLDRVVDIKDSTLEVLFDTLRDITPWTVLDLPSDWEPWTRTALIHSDRIVITATPDLVSLRNLKAMLDTLRSLRPNDEPPFLVMNQVGLQKRPEIPVKEFCEALELQPAATIEFDAVHFGEAQNELKMLPEVAPGAAATRALRDLAARLLDERQEPVKTSETSFVQKLIQGLQEKLALSKSKR